ncbi:MAG: triose-phosphate isomerase [Erysipelotrichaceae bacterium]|nr:triose-phosphate isomerase [Erysipelotrichaceae bacterium]
MTNPLRSPFFVVNPKSYLYGEEEYKLAAVAEELAVKYDVDILFTGQLVDLARIAHDFPHLYVCAQAMESLKPGRGMGHILPEALKAAGVRATFLNHAENPMTMSELTKTIARAKEVGILTVVCADDVADAKAIAQLHPDVMVCELTSLIGTGKTADESYMKATNEAVKAISPETRTLQAAGISTAEDVYKAIASGADGTGGTSGIVCAKDPAATLREMIAALDRARTDFYK